MDDAVSYSPRRTRARMQHLVRILQAVALLGLVVVTPAAAQDSGFLPELEPYPLPFLAVAHPMPAERVPAYVPPRLFLEAPDLSPLDTLDEKSRLRRIATLYRYQGELLDAQAREDHDVVEGLFDRMMSEIAVIARAPDALDDPRFKELYRSVVTEYEAYYGFPDTLHIQQGDIFAWRDQAFEALNEADLPPFATVSLPDVAIAADTDIPMQINEQVRNSMVYLLT